MKNLKSMQKSRESCEELLGPMASFNNLQPRVSPALFIPTPGCFEANPRHPRFIPTILGFVNNVKDYCQGVGTLSAAFPIYFSETSDELQPNPSPGDLGRKSVSRPGPPGPLLQPEQKVCLRLNEGSRNERLPARLWSAVPDELRV